MSGFDPTRLLVIPVSHDVPDQLLLVCFRRVVDILLPSRPLVGKLTLRQIVHELLLSLELVILHGLAVVVAQVLLALFLHELFELLHLLLLHLALVCQLSILGLLAMSDKVVHDLPISHLLLQVLTHLGFCLLVLKLLGLLLQHVLLSLLGS